ncbi:Proteasome subunit alpha type-1 [Pelomyxa schiedti]|nr:Proteasome subunit alpha type-1 [Pelomyxa schiedti]
MFRNQYDSDNVTWSPQGRLHQIEYAMEAVKQGSCSVGVKSKTHVVIATLKRSSSELGSHQEKIFKIDEHIGIAISGLCADARVLCKYMRGECMSHNYTFDTPYPVERLVVAVADKSQVHTQRYGSRPYGVGFLVAGYDTSAHLFETCPSGNYFDYKAQAIGARAQSSKTYLERHFESFQNLPLDELIHHALMALKESLQTSSKEGGPAEGLTPQNCALGIVGQDTPFHIVNDDALCPYLARIAQATTPTEGH